MCQDLLFVYYKYFNFDLSEKTIYSCLTINQSRHQAKLNFQMKLDLPTVGVSFCFCNHLSNM